MASKTIIILLIINLIITAYTEEANTSGEVKNTEESQESKEEVEDTTLPSTAEEEDYSTTTAVSIQEENTDEEVKNNIEMKHKEDEIDKKDEIIHKLDEDENFENSTDDVMEMTVSVYINDVDFNSNLTNNIDGFGKTEATPFQGTTKVLDAEEELPRAQDSKEDIESPAPRIPKAENDPTFLLAPPPQPQSTRSIVRGWLDDPWIRSPIGILVPLRATALSRALAVWTDLNPNTLNLSRICFMAYDDTGVSWRSKHSLHPSYNNHEKTVTEALSKLLMKYQGVNTEPRTDGTMRALIGAAKLVPYDSALFVLTDDGAGDVHRLPLAVRAVVEKRLKVYTLWTDPAYPSTESEEGLQALRNISRHTEGELIPYPLQVIDVDGNLTNEAELEQWSPLDPKQGRRGKLNPDVDVQKYDLLVVRRGAGQAISLGVPVENGVTALRIFIEGAVEHAVLYPPNDAPQIDLYNVSSVSSFSSSSKTESLSPRDVYLMFPGSLNDRDMLSVLPATQTGTDPQSVFVGMWHLSVRCDTCDYRLCVSARASIHFDVAVDSSESVKLRVTGPVASVRESQLVDEYGTEVAKLPFSYQPSAGEGQDVEMDPNMELVAEVASPGLKGSKVYAKIVGRDIKGEPFVRLAGPLNQPEVRMGRSASIIFPDIDENMESAEDSNGRIVSQMAELNDSAFQNRVSQTLNQKGALLTAVQIGQASRLYGSPGDNLQLHFEVTNYREQAVSFSFGASGELRLLTGINPARQTVASGQTVNVIVSLTIPKNTQTGVRDTITFAAYGLAEQVSMQAYVYVINPGDIIDTTPPELRHNFQGTCFGRTGDDCSQHTWAATVIARDPLSGLLRLSSSPIGLLYSGEFISGTRQEVEATYRATCCAPRILLQAVDAFGNTNSYVIDISGYLTEASIAAIVLGVFLILALIILLAMLIYWCVKKRKESRELPSYNTRS